MKITIETISHHRQNYPTVGDWHFERNGDLEIKVSDMGNWKMEFLVGLHEAIEAVLCKDRKIAEEDVTNFDIEFEKLRSLCPEIIGDMECGDMSSAPYKIEHEIATKLERWIAMELKVNWNDYNKAVNNL